MLSTISPCTLGLPTLPSSPGKFLLRESAMCPDEDKAHFENISLHKYFNTNNLWVNLPALKVGCLPALARFNTTLPARMPQGGFGCSWWLVSGSCRIGC